MNDPTGKPLITLPISKLENCLKELKASGATPKQMLIGMLIATCPAIVRSIGFGTASVLAAYYGVFKWLA